MTTNKQSSQTFEAQPNQKYARVSSVRHPSFASAKRNKDSLLEKLSGKDVRVKVRARKNGKFDTVTYEKIQPK